MTNVLSLLSVFKEIAKSFLFWICYFIASKILFLLYQYNATAELDFSEVLTAFFLGLKLDISITSYVIALHFLASTFVFFSPKGLSTSIRWINYVFICLFTTIQITNLELYRNWHFHIDTTPLLYINTPKEMMASVPLLHTIGLLLVTLLWSWGSIFIYQKYFKCNIKSKQAWYFAPLFLILTGAMFIPARGGIGIVSINSGSVYFSKNQFANHLAVNPVWNFQYSLTKHSRLSKSHHYMDDTLAESLTDSLHIYTGETKKVISQTRPNIVFVVLESFTSKVIGALGGDSLVTPNFNKLAKEGVLFSNLYSTADRSDKGLVAIFSGIPALPTLSMNKFPQKTQNFPGIATTLQQYDYNSEFHYGGNINFANLRSYLMNAGFTKIISADDFPSSLNTSKWGVHDHYTFDRFYETLNENQPFIKILFTLSSHEPFDIPMEQKFSGGEDELFKSSIYYTDSCLGVFINKVKQEPIWDNTLFVLVADHGTRYPNNHYSTEPIKYRIPMLWIGGPVDSTGYINSSIMSQNDIPATLLSQLDIQADSFIFSKNTFAKNFNEFSFYTYNNGFGYISDSITQVRDNNSGTYYKNDGVNSTEDSLIGLAYLQNIWRYFMKQ